jgi:transcriptional regulator with XRE-family HTH domain
MPAQSEPYESPAVVTFAKELEAWRTAEELTKKKLADALGFADSYVGQVELCKNLPSPEFADALDTFFKTNGLFRRLWERIRETRYHRILPPGFTQYVERETEARQIRAFNLPLINGLLQTEDYARAVVGINKQPDIVDQLVADRMRRQKILMSGAPLQAWFTLDEGALRRMVGGPAVMRDQLAHLLAMGERPNISIDVVPQETPYYPGLGGNFILLSFAASPDVAYIEAAGHGLLIQDAEAVVECEVRYNLLRGDALRTADSRTLIQSVMEEIGNGQSGRGRRPVALA